MSASRLHICPYCLLEFTQQGLDRHRYSKQLDKCYNIELGGDEVTSYICNTCKDYFFTALNRTNSMVCPYCGSHSVSVDETDTENPKE